MLTSPAGCCRCATGGIALDAELADRMIGTIRVRFVAVAADVTDRSCARIEGSRAHRSVVLKVLQRAVIDGIDTGSEGASAGGTPLGVNRS